MQAPRIETQTLPPPPGIIGSLRTGFDTIAAHVTVILMPLALDLLLWLGPRFSINKMAQPALHQVDLMFTSSGMKAEDLRGMLEMYASFFREFNLLGILRTFPIGVSSLMSGLMPVRTPWGAPQILEIGSLPQFFALCFLLTFAGWVLGGIYFSWVAALAAPGVASEERAPAGRAVLQSVLYALIWSVVSVVVGMPVGILLYVLFLINAWLGQIVLLLLGFISMWLVVPIFFSPHGIFIRKQNALASILSGLQMTRFTLPTSSLFVLTVFLLGVGLNLLWSRPSDDSWLVLVGILGHAFITTALLASSFVYYHNMTAWLQVALARLRAGMPGQQV
jgi:hypothetical protein